MLICLGNQRFKTKKEVIEAFESDRDFMNLSSDIGGRYANKSDVVRYLGTGMVELRYGIRYMKSLIHEVKS